MSDAPADPPARRPRRVLAVGALGATLLWLSQPPAALWPLAWIAPVCWLRLAESPGEFRRADWLRVWLAGSLYWLLTVHWVRLPHPLTPLGWAPLAAYLGLYPMGMVAAVRLGRRRGVPLWAAGPIAWTGLELLQARLFTGFLMGALSHSQAGQAWVRGIAAYAGAYGVTFVVVLVAATVTTALRRRDPISWVGVALAVAVTMGVGAVARDSFALEASDGPRARVALVQGDARATWDADPGRDSRIMDRLVALTREALAQSRRDGHELDVVVWPENMFRSPLVSFRDGAPRPADEDGILAERVANTASWFRLVADVSGGAALVVGIDRFELSAGEDGATAQRVFNSVALADGDGTVNAVYNKTHLVPFGEYIPLASGLPALYYLTPISGGLAAGKGPVALDAPLRSGGVLRLCPTICYETVVPHVVRRHVATLTDRGERPDALVNVTNDAWFWGSSELDMHLACGVYRAVETGLPLLVAANGGLSAVIGARGRVHHLSPRMAEHVVIAHVPRRTKEPTVYARTGDVFPGACLAACGLVVVERLVAALRRRFARSRATA